MADFKTKILVLTGMAMACAGMASAQATSCNTGVTGVIPPFATTNPALRIEGTTEEASDIQFQCPSASGPGGTTLTLTISGTSITSKSTGNNGITDAALQFFTDNTLGTQIGANAYGTVNGSTVTFGNVTFPAVANWVGRVGNIRVNSSTLASGATVTASIFASGGVSMSASGVPIGTVAQGLKTPGLTGTNSPGIDPVNIPACAGSSSNPSFAIELDEGTSSGFRTALQEGGSVVAGGNGVATTGTIIQVTLANLPTSGGTVYLPLAVTSGALQLVAVLNPAAGVFIAPTPASGNGIPTAEPAGALNWKTPGGQTTVTTARNGVNNCVNDPCGVFVAANSGGTATALYQVVASSTTNSEKVALPVWIYGKAGALAAQGPITALASLGPVGVPSNQIPNFVPTTNTAFNGASVTLCSTSLLFPYITTAAGYDTGVALSNTSLDPFGANGGNSGKGFTGTCSLNFYGVSGVGTATLTPVTLQNVALPSGAGYSNTGTGGAVPPGQISSFAILASLGTAGPGANFSGYMIAQCTFTDAHGFAYLLGGLTSTEALTPMTSAMGYLALVLPDPNQTGGRINDTVGGVEVLGN